MASSNTFLAFPILLCTLIYCLASFTEKKVDSLGFFAFLMASSRRASASSKFPWRRSRLTRRSLTMAKPGTASSRLLRTPRASSMFPEKTKFNHTLELPTVRSNLLHQCGAAWHKVRHSDSVLIWRQTPSSTLCLLGCHVHLSENTLYSAHKNLKQLTGWKRL